MRSLAGNRLARVVAGLTIGTMLAPGMVMAQTPVAEIDLAPVKSYLVEHVGKSKAGTEKVLGYAQTYYDLAEEAGFDYDALWAAHGPEIVTLLEDARQAWIGQGYFGDHRTVAEDEVDHSRRQTCRLEELQRQVRGNCLGGRRLPQHRVAHQCRR